MMRLFFYGTLMSTNCRGNVLEGMAQPVGRGTLRGDLYCGGGFPAVVDGDGTVHGEVWEVLPGHEARALRILDGIEGYREDNPASSMYLRQERPLLDGDGTVLVYIWNRDLGGRWKHVPSGKWVDPYDERRGWAA